MEKGWVAGGGGRGRTKKKKSGGLRVLVWQILWPETVGGSKKAVGPGTCKLIGRDTGEKGEKKKK